MVDLLGSEEDFVNDQTGEIDALLATNALDVVADAYQDETDEETGKHSNGPETAATGLHEKDGGNGSNQERSSTNKRHVVCIVFIEADLSHENRHVVHDGVDSGELA